MFRVRRKVRQTASLNNNKNGNVQMHKMCIDNLRRLCCSWSKNEITVKLLLLPLLWFCGSTRQHCQCDEIHLTWVSVSLRAARNGFVRVLKIAIAVPYLGWVVGFDFAFGIFWRILVFIDYCLPTNKKTQTKAENCKNRELIGHIWDTHSHNSHSLTKNVNRRLGIWRTRTHKHWNLGRFVG